MTYTGDTMKYTLQLMSHNFQDESQGLVMYIGIVIFQKGSAQQVYGGSVEMCDCMYIVFRNSGHCGTVLQCYLDATLMIGLLIGSLVSVSGCQDTLHETRTSKCNLKLPFKVQHHIEVFVTLVISKETE